MCPKPPPQPSPEGRRSSRFLRSLDNRGQQPAPLVFFPADTRRSSCRPRRCRAWRRKRSGPGFPRLVRRSGSGTWERDCTKSATAMSSVPAISRATRVASRAVSSVRTIASFSLPCAMLIGSALPEEMAGCKPGCKPAPQLLTRKREDYTATADTAVAHSAIRAPRARESRGPWCQLDPRTVLLGSIGKTQQIP
jgi:hypothetical protein